MDEFIRLDKSHKKKYLEYIEKNFYNNLYLNLDFDKSLINHKKNKKSGDYYGYFSNGELKGVFVFSNNNILHMSYIDSGVLRKVDLLRAIKFYKPKIIKGFKKQVKELLDILNRSIKLYSSNHYNVMEYSKNFFDLKYKFGYLDINIINNSFDFLIDVEKSFGRNPKLINDIKKKVLKKYKDEEYFCIIEDNKIISQGMLENIGEKFIVIGGIYTKKTFRKKGYGTIIIKKLVNEVLSRKKVPILLVNKKNKNAYNLYKKLNFKVLNDFFIAEVNIQ
ncbi:MAG: GNAT family N-acetyltransferase [Bacillota bacterium]